MGLRGDDGTAVGWTPVAPRLQRRHRRASRQSEIEMQLVGRIRKVIFGAAAVVFTAAFILDGALVNTYVGYPRAPDVATQRTVPYVAKRVLVYISEDERKLLSWLRNIEIASGAVIALNLILSLRWPLK